MEPEQRSWMEKTFGDSWESSLAGYGLGGLGLLLAVLGSILKISEMTTIGMGALGTAIIVIGAKARTQAQHDRDWEREQAAKHAEVKPDR